VPGGARQQHALWDLGTDPDETLGRLQEVNDLREFLLGLVNAGDICELHAGFRSDHHLGLVLVTEARHAWGARPGTAAEEKEARDDQQGEGHVA